jgi:hypothetical protein
LEWLEGVSAKEGGEEEEERDIHMLVWFNLRKKKTT